MARAARSGDLVGRLARQPALREQPFGVYDEVRAQGPLIRGGFGVTTATHAVVEEALRSPDFGVSFDMERAPWLVRRALRVGDAIGTSGVVEPPSMLAVDPPDHTRYRRLVSRAFTPRAVAALEDGVQRTADALLDDLEREVGAVDLVDRYAALLPVIVIAELLGVPLDRREDFLRWGEAAAATLDAGLSWRRFVQAEQAIREMHAFLGEHFERLRKDPGDDLVSALVALEGEDALTPRELHATVMLLLGAGFETTVNLLGNAVVLLDRHRDQWDALRADPAGWDLAVEEALRYDSPVQLTVRHAHADTSLAGVPVPRGSMVTMLIGGANRDPAVFTDPHDFDTTRANAREHLAFSGGSHYCLGAGLARLEAVVGLRTLTQRFPNLRVAGTPVRRDLQTLRGFASVPVLLR